MAIKQFIVLYRTMHRKVTNRGQVGKTNSPDDITWPTLVVDDEVWFFSTENNAELWIRGPQGVDLKKKGSHPKPECSAKVQ